MYFIINKGQVNKKALFYAKASRYTLWITKEGLVFDSHKAEEGCDQGPRDKLMLPDHRMNQKTKKYERDVSRLMFLGANINPEVIPVKETELKVNYFKGNDRSKYYNLHAS